MRCCYLFAALACALPLGCSSSGASGGGSTVKGKVLFNGNPVAGARVIFTDGKEEGIPSGPTALSDESGEYAIVGAKPGSYKVVVYKLVAKPGATLPTDDSGAPDLVQLEASGAGYHALPQKYSRVTSTTLTAQVNEGSNDIDLKLTGKVERAGP